MEPGAAEGDVDPEQQKLVQDPPPPDDNVFEIRYGSPAEAEDGGIYYEYGSEKASKLNFIRRVYLCLLVQLIATAGVSALCMYDTAVREYVTSNPALWWLGIILSIVLLITMWFVRNVPVWNLVVLALWTLVMAYTVGVICGFYVQMGYREAVLQAFGLTIALFVALTLFTIQSKIDFSFLGVALFACLWILVIWGIIIAFTGYQSMFWYSLFGAIVFCLLIIFDTWWMIRRGGWYEDGAWILAAINLYLDVINLFIFLLQLFAGGPRR